MHHLSDIETAKLIVDSETSRISYADFDRWAGINTIDNDCKRNNQRSQVARRINTILERGISSGDTLQAYRLEVEEKGSHFQLRPLAESAVDSIKLAAKKTAQAFDRAAKRAAYTLGEKHYFCITDQRIAAITKPSPGLTKEELSELRSEYRLLQQTQRLLSAMLDDAEANIHRIDQLTQSRRQLPSPKQAPLQLQAV